MEVRIIIFTFEVAKNGVFKILMAKKKREGLVKFREGYNVITADNGEPIVLPVFAYRSVTVTHTKRFHNCLYLLAGLPSCARDLMDYIAEEMDDENVFYSNENFRLNFRKFIEGNTNGTTSYSDSSVKKALHTLLSKGLIRQIKRGYGKVNPMFFWKTDNGDKRVESIKIELEFKHDVDTQLRVMQETYGVDAIKEDNSSIESLSRG